MESSQPKHFFEFLTNRGSARTIDCPWHSSYFVGFQFSPMRLKRSRENRDQNDGIKQPGLLRWSNGNSWHQFISSFFHPIQLIPNSFHFSSLFCFCRNPKPQSKIMNAWNWLMMQENMYVLNCKRNKKKGKGKLQKKSLK